MSHDDSVKGDSFDVEQLFSPIPMPAMKTSSPSSNGDVDAMALPEFTESSKISHDACSENDEFDTSFMANNNHTARRVSFLRSPTPGSLNTTNASRGVSITVLYLSALLVCYVCSIKKQHHELFFPFGHFVAFKGIVSQFSSRASVRRFQFNSCIFYFI